MTELTTKVCLTPRVVAAGVHGDKFRLTLALLPTAPAAAPDGAPFYDIADWPRAVAAVETLDLLVSPVTRQGDKRPAPDPDAAMKEPIPLHRRHAPGASDVETASRLWRSVMTGRSGADAQRRQFLHLCAVLAASQRDPTVKDQQTPARTDQAIEETPAILPTGRADAALAYTMERAERILSALRNEVAPAATGVVPAGRSKPTPWSDDPHKTYWRSGNEQEVAARGEAALAGALAERAKAVAREVQPEVVRGTSQVSARRAYLEACTLSAAVAQLAGGAAGRCSRNPGEVSDASSTGSRERVRLLHEANTLPDTRPLTREVRDVPGSEVAERRLFAIQAHPTLGRLFQLVIDVEGDLAHLERSLHHSFAERFGDLAARPDGEGGAPRPAPTAAFAFLACDLGAAAKRPTVWALAKATRPPKGHVSWFWPCTREEMEFAVSDTPGNEVLASCAVNQVDGVLDLGMAVSIPPSGGVSGIPPEGHGCRPGEHRRFDVVSVDTVLSTEADVRRERHAEEVAHLAARAGAAAPGAARLPSPRPILTTAGLALVDRWRQQRVASEIATSLHNRSRKGVVVLDAEDLTVGHKVDLGVRVTGGWTWRTLMNRTVSFGLPDRIAAETGLPVSVVDDVIRRLVPDRGERVLLESGTVTVASRLRDDAGSVTIHVEENVADWQGDPLGAACKTQALEVSADVDLGLSRTYGLPSRLDGATEAAEMALPARFGWSYRIGMRATYVGGVAAPLDRAATRYDHGLDGRFSAPRRLVAAECGDASAAQGRRLLRHEAVGRPIVLRTAEEAAKPTPFGPQSTDVVILRTCRTDPTRSDPRFTRRVVLAPRIEQAFATRHGVFDDLRDLAGTVRPHGGLAAIDFDAPWGEFPLFRAPSGAVSAGAGLVEARVDHRLEAWHDALSIFACAAAAAVAAVAGRGVVTPPMSPRRARHWTWAEAKADFERRRLAREFDAHAWLHATRLAHDEVEARVADASRALLSPLRALEEILAVPQGEPVFRPRRVGAGDGGRAKAYYPDPAADAVVIAARRFGTTTYLPGRPLMVSLGDPRHYPETAPVVLDFVAMDAAGPSAPGQTDVVRRVARARGGMDRAFGRPPASATIVEVLLAPGEHVAIDVWCVPDATRLAAIFDAIESVALCATGAAAPGLAATDACLAGLAIKLGTPAPPPPSNGRAWCGGAGVPATTGGVMAAAKLVHDHMAGLPLPDVAAVRTIDCLNVVDQPRRRPSFAVPPNVTGLRIALYDGIKERDALIRQGAASWAPTLETAADGRVGVLFGGDVSVDRATTGRLELEVSCVAPRSKVIDSAARSRTKEERYRGIWPRRIEAHDQYLRASDLFGFEVAADGRVTLLETSDVALRFEVIDEPGHEGAEAEVLDLLAQQIIEDASAKDAGPAAGAARGTPAPKDSGERPPLFPGGLARRLTLRLVATARHLSHFRRIAPGRDGTLEGPFPAPAEGRAGRGSPAVTAESEAIVRWLPATRRPDPVQRRSIVPAFVWSHGEEVRDARVEAAASVAFWTRRTAVLRVRMERGWFSSGAGERLGVVVWPPALFSLDPDDLAAGRVPRMRPAGELTELMDLADFDDASLGEGGPFVSRWGADPIRAGSGLEGPLMPARAFADYDVALDLTACASSDAAYEAALDGDRPIYVARARMPLPRRSGEPKAAPVRFLPVGILAYVPRFDVEQECWYVDVAIDSLGAVEPFVRLGLVRYQPRAPVDLQVSQPIVEWAQILPERTLRASVGRSLNGRLWPVHVDVSGDASRRTREPVPSSGPTRPFPSREPRASGLPKVRMRLLREGVTAGGNKVRSWASVAPVPFAAAGDSLPAATTAAPYGRDDAAVAAGAEVEVDVGSGAGDRPAGSGSWTHTFYSTIDPGSLGRNERLVVEVEEFEEFAPATYAQEPIGEGDALAKTSVSGPRFVARLAL